MQRISIEFSPGRYVIGGIVLGVILFSDMPAQAEQQLQGMTPYTVADPFDPSETVNHTLKDDIRLRLRLPEPDLPLSIVEAKHPQPSPLPRKNTAPPTPEMKQTSETQSQPGILGKSIQSVISIFDWSDNDNVETAEATPAHSDEPIRINVHVGIKKPEGPSLVGTSNEEVSKLETPWARNQERVRRLFTFGEIRTHE